MIRYGTVTSIFPDKGTVKVTFEDLNIPSAEIPVLQGRTEKTKHYSMPKIGESGICIFPENSFSGFYLGSGYNDATPIPVSAKEGVEITVFNDGTIISYDEKSSKLYINCNNKIEIVAQNIKITCPKTEIIGDINVTGTIDVKGSVNASEEVSAKGIELSEHTHSGVKAGGDTTGGPQ